MGAFTHVTVGTNDLETSRAFYDKVLGTLGWDRVGDLGDEAVRLIEWPRRRACACSFHY